MNELFALSKRLAIIETPAEIPLFFHLNSEFCFE